ncbi:hypothetical protein IGI04_038463 [Brassica rapa subsp. trilocularis]|uniref:Zinc finger GRF-type domain-containing protein n=1 Tax=Brassica rapa subsp. trilocularis TaxID=1813537 RepID=A0ABQ7LK97_BRACM|nr:hypothetical protein IGI04_038463 [Brassica rapa subsp. trilocularis]
MGWVSPYDTGSSHASDRHWPRVFASRGRKIGLRGFSLWEAISRATRQPENFSIESTSETLGSFLEDLKSIWGFLLRVPNRMDPAEERRETKRQTELINMQGYVADSEYGIPTRCPCGGRIIDEVRGKDDYDTLPGKRFFTCKNYTADGFHYRQPWVIGVQEHIERLTKRLEEVELVINGLPEVNYQIERLERLKPSIGRLITSLDRFITSQCRSRTWRSYASTEKRQSSSENTNQSLNPFI